MSNEEKLYCVYKHTNKINGKIYIGKTCANPPEKRWRNDGSGYIKSPLFWNAIQNLSQVFFNEKVFMATFLKSTLGCYNCRLGYFDKTV